MPRDSFGAHDRLHVGPSSFEIVRLDALDPIAGGYMVDTHVDQEALRRAVVACYDVRADDALLRFALTMGPKHMAPYFDGLRRDYRKRREFAALKVTCHRRRAARLRREPRIGHGVVAAAGIERVRLSGRPAPHDHLRA